ncbi:uncharacterized protein Bfra_006171 [Botrytis fragariae]|uniref:F-box domain-containing protein n=1 Tax=Botrytis fragariae TaxID=1964551 RepID=A0A8H6EHV8_9HELO|nr:uncharacterized protein Bfra_006171 [Botrytis fragariae]KAF5872808.1 hypothetical protein Bfra_006171 [Botrytis fragariae]
MQVQGSLSYPTPGLLRIPLELRTKIFKYCLGGRTVYRGFNSYTDKRTSLLRTCRQICDDVKHIILSTFLFHFASTFFMVDTLIGLPISIISQIRNIRVKGYPFSVATDFEWSSERNYGEKRGVEQKCEEEDDKVELVHKKRAFEAFTTYPMAYTLSLFPGLQLNKLIVEDVHHGIGQYEGFLPNVQKYNQIQSLIRQNGWRELRFLTSTTVFVNGNGRSYLVEQPAGWDKDIKEMDGTGSGAECKMFAGENYGQDEDENAIRQVWEIDPDARSAWIGIPKDEYHGPKQDPYQQVLVVVKRGKDTDYMNDGSHECEKFEALFDNMTWDEIKETNYRPPKH